MPPVARERGDSLKMLKQILKGLWSRLLLTKLRNGKGVLPTRITTLKKEPRSDFLLRSSASVAKIMFVLIVAKCAIGSMTVLNPSLDSLSVL